MYTLMHYIHSLKIKSIIAGLYYTINANAFFASSYTNHQHWPLEPPVVQPAVGWPHGSGSPVGCPAQPDCQALLAGLQ